MNDALRDLVIRLREMPPCLERDIVLFRWKFRNWPPAGLFSTAHGGDASGNFLRALDGDFDWPETAVCEGKTIVLEYEKNFNAFVKWAKVQLADSAAVS